uniref:Uncharacterized protein n=1 Tax=Tanacetum cinerariifolium TaxID=118510 RepID=A0A699KXF1_TANCI|nr:hypothetical protein [Tanacetum cinerariifolium]
MICIKSSHATLVFATIIVSLNDVTYAIRVRELCTWTPSFMIDDSDSEEDGPKGSIHHGKEENFADSDAESVADFVADLEPGVYMDTNQQVQNDDDEKDKEQVNDYSKKEVEPSAKDLFSYSDLFGLDPLINKTRAKEVVEKCSVTPEYLPGYSLIPIGEHHESQSFHQLSDDTSPKQAGFSMIQRLEETIKVGTALGLNMEGCENNLANLLAGMNAIYINVQGFGDLNKRRWVRDLCNIHKVNFLPIQET